MPPTSTSTQVPIPSDVNFYDDFSDKSMDKWKVYGGAFNASSGSLVASKSLGGKAVLNSNFSNFIFDADITLLSNSGNAGLIFRVSDPEVGADAYKGYYCGFGASGIVLLGWAKGDWMELAHAPANTSLNQIHHLKVVALAQQFYVYVNLEMHDFSIHINDAKYSLGMNGVRVWDTAAAFDNIRIKPFHFKPGTSLDGY